MPFTKKKWVWMIALLLVMVIGFCHQSSVEAGELNVGLKPIFPENQMDKSLPYYELRVTPGQKQVIEIEATNHSDHDVTLLSYATNATTGNEGVLDYQNLKSEVNATLKHPFSKIAKVPEKTVLGPKEVTMLKIEIDVPTDPFKGYILGGLYFKEDDGKSNDKGANNDSDDEGEGIKIKNTFSYVMTVSLSESDEEIKPKLELTDARAGQVHYQNVMEGNLQNPEPDILEDLSIVAKVYKKGSTVPLFKKESINVRMAPNSNFYYYIPLRQVIDGQEKFVAVEAGKYEFEIVARNDTDEWTLKKEFEVTKEEADKLNKESMDELEYPVNYLFWGIVGGVSLLVLFLLILMIVLLVNKKRKKNAVSEKKSKSNKKSSKSKKSSSSSSKKGRK